jgi:hypothetical protein
MNNNLIEVFIVIVIILVLLFIDYLKHRCPKCRTWHFFRYGLITLDKSCEKHDREWVKCKKCGHELEILKVGRDSGYLGGGMGE